MTYFMDANCFKYYIDAIINENNSSHIEAVNHVLSNSTFVLDDAGLFLQEWKQTTGGAYNPFVDDLVSNWLASGQIKLSKFIRNNTIKTKIISLGVPKIDARIIEFSTGTDIDVILTEDIDLYEPSLKSGKASKRTQVICGKKGSVARYVKREFRIQITCCCHFDTDVI